MHLQIATACQEDSFSYLALMQTFIIQTGFSEACAVLFLMNKKKTRVRGKCCHAGIPDETGTTSHLNNRPTDPSSWAETCLGTSAQTEPLDWGWDAGVPAACVCLGSPLCSAPAWESAGLALHCPTEELNCAFAVLRTNIWLNAYRKMSQTELCCNNINIILHEAKSIFVVWVSSQGLKAKYC